MSSLIVSIAMMAFSLLPSDVAELDLVLPKYDTVNNSQGVARMVKFAKQPGGSWRASLRNGGALGLFTLEGDRLLIAPPVDSGQDGLLELDMSDVFNSLERVNQCTLKDLSTRNRNDFQFGRSSRLIVVSTTSGDDADQELRFEIRLPR